MRKSTVRILTGAAILVVALAAIYAVGVGISVLKLRRAYALMRETGRPMKPADIIAAAVPDTENAVLFYQSAALMLKAQPAGEKDLLEHLGNLAIDYVNDSADPNQHVELRRLMQREDVATAIETVLKGTTRPACQFGRDYGSGPVIPPSPHLSDLRFLTGILSARAILDAEAGRTEQAWEMVLAQLKFANALRAEPTLIFSQLVRIAQFRLACMTVRRLCENAIPDPNRYHEIQDTLAGFDDVEPLVRSVDGERLLVGERVFGLERDDLQEFVTETEGNDYVPGIIQTLRTWRITFRPLLLADHAAYLHVMRICAERLRQPYSLDETEALETELAELSQGHVLAELLTPAMARVKEVYLRTIAESRVTRAGLALLQHRRTHDALPERLDVLGLHYAQDPFSSEALVYRPEPEGFTLYSIAQDQQDNGGRPKQADEYTDYDLVWRFRHQAN